MNTINEIINPQYLKTLGQINPDRCVPTLDRIQAVWIISYLKSRVLMISVKMFRDTSSRDTISCSRFHTYEVPVTIIPNDGTNTAHTYNLLLSYLSTVAAGDCNESELDSVFNCDRKGSRHRGRVAAAGGQQMMARPSLYFFRYLLT
jgi:hypothetical protein